MRHLRQEFAKRLNGILNVSCEVADVRGEGREPEEISGLPSDISHASPRSWFVVRTKPRQETVARDQLQNQNFEVYLPQVNTRITHARKVSWQPRPLFSGYLFMHLSREEQRWTTIRSTVGVLAPVSFGAIYPPVPDAAIDMLQSRHDEQGYILVEKSPKTPFKTGEKVRLHDGSLKGLDGIFVEMRGEDRALVLLRLGKRANLTHPTGNPMAKTRQESSGINTSQSRNFHGGKDRITHNGGHNAQTHRN